MANLSDHDLLQMDEQWQGAQSEPVVRGLLGRALEDRGDRLGAAVLLDRAAQAANPGVLPIGAGGTAGELTARWSANPAAQGAVVPYVRSQLIAGNLPGAASAARRLRPRSGVRR